MYKLEKRLERRSRALNMAEMRQNYDEVIEYYLDNAVVHIKGSPLIKGKKEIKNTYDKVFSGINFLEFTSATDEFDYSVSKKLAYEYGHGEMLMQEGDQKVINHSKYMIIWKFLNNNWFIEGLSFVNDIEHPEIVKNVLK